MCIFGLGGRYCGKFRSSILEDLHPCSGLAVAGDAPVIHQLCSVCGSWNGMRISRGGLRIEIISCKEGGV